MSAEGSSASVVRDALGREGALGGPSGESESFYLREKLCDRSSIACISFTEFLFKNILEDLQIIQLFAKIKLSFRRISLDETLSLLSAQRVGLQGGLVQGYRPQNTAQLERVSQMTVWSWVS